ncbi:MAG: GNAT family N-acetyltransferase [Chloroflexi bacterium]|nr:GNAT family N-acetyltransferase [Chloroflexota bacterium]
MSQLGFTIRPATLNDVDTLTRFAVEMAMETEGHKIEAESVKIATLAALNDSGKAIFFVAEVGSRVVGSLMVTYEWSDWENGDYWWIQSVYVSPPSRRQGIYRGLYNHVVAEAKRQGDVVGVKLYVYKDNLKAQKTYETLGMKRAPHYIYEIMLTEQE